MSENEQCHNDDVAMENNMSSITKSISMKHGWNQRINHIVCCCQTPFNIALILEQALNDNNLLREQMNVENIHT